MVMRRQMNSLGDPMLTLFHALTLHSSTNTQASCAFTWQPLIPRCALVTKQLTGVFPMSCLLERRGGCVLNDPAAGSPSFVDDST